MGKKKKKDKRNFHVTVDATILAGKFSLDFFDSVGNYQGEITLWKNGEVWVSRPEIEGTIKFKNPDEFFQNFNR
jgi:hypothetical protein